MLRRPVLFALVPLAMLALAAPGIVAPAVPFGQPLALSVTDGFFRSPDVAIDRSGRALVVWHGEAAGQPIPDNQIYGRLLGAPGPPGPVFTVNEMARGQQRRAAVAADPRGGFVVAWDQNSRTLWARRVAADGPLLGSDIAVSRSDAFHRDADLAVAADGSFVVAWQLTPPQGPDRVALRRFRADGTPSGDEQLPVADGAAQLNPALAALPDSRLALAWEQQNAVGDGAIKLALLDAAGTLVGEPRTVATGRELRDPSLAAGPAGEVVVAWSAASAGGEAILARGYRPDGVPSGAALVLSAPESAARSLPSVAVTGDGTALVAWSDAGGSDGPLGPVARVIDPTGGLGVLILARPPEQPRLLASAVAVAVGPGVSGPRWVIWAQSPAGQGEEISAIYARRLAEQVYEVALPVVRQ